MSLYTDLRDIPGRYVVADQTYGADIFDVGGGTRTSLDPRDHPPLHVTTIPIVPHELAATAPGLPQRDWPYQIPGMPDVAVPARPMVILDAPHLAAFDPMSAQRPAVLVDLVGALPVPPTGPVLGLGNVSPIERMVTGR